MEVKKGYKQTEVGVIPEEWEVNKQENVVKFINGRAYRLSEWESYGTPVIRLQNLTGTGDDYYFSSLNLPEKQYVENGDLIFMWSASFGPFIWRGVRAIYHYHIWKIECDDSKIDKLFYYHKLTELTEKLKSSTSGSTMLHLTKKGMEEFRLAIPPLPEQRAIAEALSDVDALISKLDALIAKKRAIKQGAMQQLLTGKKPLQGYGGKWKTHKLGEFANIGTGKRNTEDKIDEGLFPFFIRSKTVERINSYSYDGEAILVPGEGGIGTIIHYINGKFDVHQRVYKLSDFGPNFSVKFVFYVMMLNFNNHAMTQTVKATVDSLRLPTFQSFEFLAPSVEEQIQIAAILSDMDQEISDLESQLAKTKALKQGMMQELLTGRIRLV